ncbi:Gfo/Idh/MocA family protein [Actinacidiphila sp. ITFR-21]|uniref:Gfo/Idh/MocA family protein n=1 Tax=Actinacidiphila sp. ITFR-21 TaxID=3075199 RepID=UPI00288B2026|nr:Gfo/Idh/MocA family oxidoreductase [Streptomyces sp. ITFR-21]WNI18734.1 Gfo/Idh/MocA family oxidoreductase [Streptomyces sp. ITFR-21]
MKPLRLGVVGTGYFSQYHYEAWSRMEDVEYAGLAYGSNADRARAVAEAHGVPQIFTDVEDMLDKGDVDLLDVISPPETHLAIIDAAVRRGVPVITQKPVATSLAEAVSLADRVRAADGFVVVHDNWRFKPWFREARRLITGGALGEVHNVQFRLRPGDGQGDSAYADRQAYFRDMPRFLIHETGIHLIDSFRYLLGEVSAVSARLRRLNPGIAGEDAGHVLVEFLSGAAGLIDGNRLIDFPAERPRLTMGELLVEGTAGQLRLTGDGRLHLHSHGGEQREHSYRWTDRNYGGDCVYALQRHVVDHLRHDGPVENPISDYLRNLEVEEAVYESDRTGCRIELDADRSPAVSPTSTGARA